MMIALLFRGLRVSRDASLGPEGARTTAFHQEQRQKRQRKHGDVYEELYSLVDNSKVQESYEELHHIAASTSSTWAGRTPASVQADPRSNWEGTAPTSELVAFPVSRMNTGHGNDDTSYITTSTRPPVSGVIAASQASSHNLNDSLCTSTRIDSSSSSSSSMSMSSGKGQGLCRGSACACYCCCHCDQADNECRSGDDVITLNIHSEMYCCASGGGGIGGDESSCLGSPYDCPAVLEALCNSKDFPVLLLPGAPYPHHLAARYGPRSPFGFSPGLPLNSPHRPISVDTHIFIGCAYVFLPGLSSTPPGLFKGRKRRFVLVLQGRFKRAVSAADLMVGCHYRRPLKLEGSAVPVASVLSWVSRLLAPGGRGGGMELVLTGRDPRVRAPLAAAAQMIHVARPGEQPHPLKAREDTRLMTPPLMDSGQGEPWASARRRHYFRQAEHRTAHVFDTEHVWTFHTWDQALGYGECSDAHTWPPPSTQTSCRSGHLRRSGAILGWPATANPGGRCPQWSSGAPCGCMQLETGRCRDLSHRDCHCQLRHWHCRLHRHQPCLLTSTIPPLDRLASAGG
ncbi:hypothetical protein VaNZ11_012122 [Volvox africanus]|uniref:Domain of unknown function at the cortex 1 domain-containing protein n=1 Tax=Volvox africanus TaxID=51714 RepID=A0ABQ5SEG5_9CHLO|nr:hypothetical protein VaNZ11_012122 [Volvox africanus]